jgi:hypothetical protein
VVLVISDTYCTHHEESLIPKLRPSAERASKLLFLFSVEVFAEKEISGGLDTIFPKKHGVACRLVLAELFTMESPQSSGR